MSDDVKTAPTNGNGHSYGRKVAAQLFKLVDELEAYRKEDEVIELRLAGLAKVIERDAIPFGVEQIEQVSNVIKEAGDRAHGRGSVYYERAGRIRKVAGQ